MDINEKLMKCLKHVGVIIDSDDFDSLTDFIEDSITFITLIVELEQEFDIEIPDEYLKIESLETISSIKNIINEQIEKGK